MNYSLTYAGIIASVIASVGLLNQADALTFVHAAIVLITAIITMYGRYRAGGVHWSGFKI